MSGPPPRVRAGRARLLLQLVLVLVLAAGVAALVHITAKNMDARGIRSGFDFLFQPAGFAIGESVLPFAPGDSVLRAFLAGLTNTVRVAALAVVLCTVLGVAIGLGRLSANALLAGLCGAYVETFRNVPLLLQLLAWYFVLTEFLPVASEAWGLGPFFLSKSGLAFPWWVDGAWEVPERGFFAVTGGAALTPEFLALLVGLGVYTAAYVAETVRGGVLAVPRGQTDAGLALGLSRRQVFFLVLLPQARRAILPPLTGHYLNLTKNSSLAVAIGYPDLMSVANTTLNQSGRAVECIVLVMAIYLLLSLATTAFTRGMERRSRRWAEAR